MSTIVRKKIRKNGREISIGGKILVKKVVIYGFTTVFRTDNNEETITLPLNNGNGSEFDFTIDWGDGTIESYQTHIGVSHQYAFAGDYTIEITGKCEGWSFNNTGDRLKLIEIKDWGDHRLFDGFRYLKEGFYGCSNMVCTAADTADVSRVTSLKETFRNCSLFNGAISNWNVSNVTVMPLMFQGAALFNQDISGWDVSNVNNMAQVFFQATAFNQNIGNWDVSNVNNMIYMFFGATSFNQNIGSWNTGKVLNMGFMFQGAVLFNQDISGWDVSKVTTMEWMFRGASAFNQDISGWDVSNVNNMIYMFFGASAFNQNLGNWTPELCSNMTDMFVNGALDTTNYNAILTGWTGWVAGTGATKALQDNVSFHAGISTQYSAGEPADARAYLVDTVANGGKEWDITDGGQE